jgi:hypothetical protein
MYLYVFSGEGAHGEGPGGGERGGAGDPLRQGLPPHARQERRRVFYPYNMYICIYDTIYIYIYIYDICLYDSIYIYIYDIICMMNAGALRQGVPPHARQERRRVYFTHVYCAMRYYTILYHTIISYSIA